MINKVGMVEFITLAVAIYGAILSTTIWISKRAKWLRVNVRAENTSFEGKIIGENIIFQIINISTKPVFIKYAFLLNQKNGRLLISPESFWGSNGEMKAEDITNLYPDRMFEVVYDRKEVAQSDATRFIVEDETGKQFSASFDITELKPTTYIVSKNKSSS